MASVAEGLPAGVAAAAQRQRPAVVGEGVFLSLVIGDPQADAERQAVGGDLDNERAIEPTAHRHATGGKRALRVAQG